MDRSIRVAGSVVIALSVALAACTLLVDTSGLDDEGAGSTDGGGADGTGSEASAIDAADGGRPDAPGTDSGGDGACTATFCDDFDHGALGVTWSDRAETRGALSLANDARSPPNALRIDMPAGSDQTNVSLTKDFAGAPPNMRCEMDIKILEPPPDDGQINYVYFTTSGSAATLYILYLSHLATGWVVAEYGEFPTGPAIDRQMGAATPPLGSWFHLVMTTDGASLGVSYDGADAGAIGSLAFQSGTKRSAQIGIPFASTKQAHVVQFDNVACTVTL